MAKVTITITDTDNGSVNIAQEFDPAVTKDAELTPAQTLAIIALNAMTDGSEIEDEEDEEDEEAAS